VIPMMACSLFTSLDGLNDGSANDGGSSDGPNGGGGDGSPIGDGATKQDGSQTGSDSGAPNLVVNGSFENGTGGCGTGWGGGLSYGATFQRSDLAHTGSSSCEICPIDTSGTGSFALAPNTAFEAIAGSYYAEAWIHAPADAGAAAQSGIQVFLTYADGGAPPVYQGTQVAPNDGWLSTSEGFSTNGDGQMTLQIHTYVGGGCVLVDDVAIYAQ
jgi:hypothetical protein